MRKIKYYENDEEVNVDFDDLKDLEKKGINFVNDGRFIKSTQRSFKDKIMRITPLLVTAIYLFCGFQYNLWHPLWALFFLIPLVFTLLYSKRFLSMSGIVLLIICTYLFIGFYWNIWHPSWLIFFLIPISGILIGDSRKHNME